MAPFPDEASLDDHLSTPGAQAVSAIAQVRGPLLVLGAGGKMGPTLAVMARRAAEASGHSLRIVAVSRFQNPSAREWLETRGVETISADLLEEEQVRALPDAGAVLYLVGLKFGTASDPSATWVANTVVPAHVARRYAGTRMVALSTGNVYPFVPVQGPPATEAHALTPLGEYANAAVARERVFEWAARRYAIPLVLVRLSYAVEVRYGVLHDLARQVWEGVLVPLANGWFNCLWQRDANEAILQLLAHARTPPLAVNLTGAEVLSVRQVAMELGRRLGRAVQFEGVEAETALLSDTSRMRDLVGGGSANFSEVLEAVADWVRQGGRSLGKPTRFEVRSGRY